MARRNTTVDTGERCLACGRPLDQPRRGRRRRHCSHACRQVAYRRRRHGQQQRRLVRRVQADAREWLPTLPCDSIDLIVTDPPYQFRRGNTFFRNWFPMLDDNEWPTIFHELYRVLRPDRHCYVFADVRVKPIFDHAAKDAGFRILRPLIWDKHWPGLGHGAWRPQYEYVCLYSKGSRPGNHNGKGDVLRQRRPARGYPTQKPIPLLEQLIAQSSQPGETILDPFAGSGTTGHAARNLRRRALLCDLKTPTQ